MTEKISRRLPEGSWTEDEDSYVETWNQLGTAVAKFFPGYWLGGYDPGIRLDNNVETIRFSVTQAKLLLQTQAEKQAESDALRAALKDTRAELTDFYKAKWRWEIPKPPYAVRMPQEAVIAKLEELLTKDPFDRAALIESAYWDEGITYDWDEEVAALSHKVREHFEPGWQRLNEELGEKS